jgi:hypothetical protein
MQSNFTLNSKANTAVIKFPLPSFEPEDSLVFGTAHPGPCPEPDESISGTSTHFFVTRSTIILGSVHHQ